MHPVVRKLSVFADFTPEEASALEAACAKTVAVPAHTDVARAEDPPISVFFLLSGLICRHKMLPSGRRQILSFMIPGDSCDIGVTVLERRDHSLTALKDSVVARITDEALDDICAQYPKIKAALLWASLVEEAISREWILNVGARPADNRAAHLICEFYYRLQSIGMADGLNFELPITQSDLADALGISAVHSNRTVQALRRRNLIAFGDKRMTILDLPALEELAEFESTYLHLDARYEPRPEA